MAAGERSDAKRRCRLAAPSLQMRPRYQAILLATENRDWHGQRSPRTWLEKLKRFDVGAQAWQQQRHQVWLGPNLLRNATVPALYFRNECLIVEQVYWRLHIWHVRRAPRRYDKLLRHRFATCSQNPREFARNKFAEAKAVLDEAGKISGKVGEDSSEVALTRLLQARWHEERNEWAEAERTYRSAHAALAKNADQGATDAEFSRVKLDWSRALIELGRLDEATTLLAHSKIALGESSGSNDIASPDFHCISGELDMANNRFESAVANLDRGLDLFAKLDVAVPSSEIRCRRSRVNALLALNRAHDARLEAAKAFTLQQEASPQAKGKLAGLLALRARAEQADADPSAAAASIEQARLLAAPVELLSTADRTTLEL